MALYFYFNETTGDLVYSDQATYAVEGYASLGEQTNMKPTSDGDWVFGSKKSGIKTVTKDPAVAGKIAGLTSMAGMFSGCSSLTSLDLSNFDTSKVTSMLSMFSGCSSLTSLDLSNFDTSKVTSMLSMFDRCFDLTSLDLSGFDTSQVMSMNYMFNGCSGLTSLDLSGFDTSKATGQMISMFAGCSLDIVRCRPKQFLKPDFIIPSSSGAWYDFKGVEVTDFSSDAATSLYSDPSKAPDGSKLVNLQDLKAALMNRGGLPLTKDTVIAEIEGKPVWVYAANAIDDGAPGFISRIDQGESWIEATFGCNGLRIEESMLSDAGQKNMSISMEMNFDGPVIKFGDEGLRGGLAYQNGMPILTAMGESGPIMAGKNPYGFATYATDDDFMNYVFQEG